MFSFLQLLFDVTTAVLSKQPDTSNFIAFT